MPSKSFIKNKIVLLTGAAGSIGRALAKRILEGKPKTLLLLDNNESDLFNLLLTLKGDNVLPVLCSICDDEIEEVFRQWRPHLVINSAAYKHVVMLEKAPLQAIKINIGGTLNLIRAAIKYKTKKFVQISTDKAVRPTSIMGETKKICEQICQLLLTSTEFVTVRFGNVLASRGSVVEIFKNQIKEGKPLTVTDKQMKRFTMGIFDAADLVLKAAELGKGGESFTFDMGSQVSVDELARLMIRLSGKDLTINYIGANKGEKYEEALYDEKTEELKKTKYPQIFEIKKRICSARGRVLEGAAT